MRISYTILLFGSIAATGCQSESAPGGPGAPQVKKEAAEANADERTFTVKGPTMSTAVDRGAKDEVTIAIDRGSDFNQNVKLKFQAPADITITPADPVIRQGQDETKVFVEAKSGAELGEKMVTITGVPESGSPTSTTMKVTVNEP